MTEPARWIRLVVLLVLPAALLWGGLRADPAPVYGYEVIRAYPHDPGAFTQGLVYDPATGRLWEGTGLHGHSTLREVDLETGAVLRYLRLPEQFFGEGVTLYQDRLLQLTWRSRIGFVLDKDSLALLGTFDYPTEGWGLTHDGRRLIMSDGSATLYFLDPDTLRPAGRVEVHDEHGPVDNLNELEFVRGEVYANIWKEDRIARIDPASGRVTGWLDLSGLLEIATEGAAGEDVLNGIAYDADGDRLFVTGKLWPRLFEIRLLPP